MPATGNEEKKRKNETTLRGYWENRTPDLILSLSMRHLIQGIRAANCAKQPNRFLCQGGLDFALYTSRAPAAKGQRLRFAAHFPSLAMAVILETSLGNLEREHLSGPAPPSGAPSLSHPPFSCPPQWTCTPMSAPRSVGLSLSHLASLSQHTHTLTASPPQVCMNFLKLCKAKAYNFSLVHRIDRDFCVTTGRTELGSSVWGLIKVGDLAERARF